jgi:hypothetical protein
MLYYLLTIYAISYTHHLCYIIYSPFMLYYILTIYVILYTHHLCYITYSPFILYYILTESGKFDNPNSQIHDRSLSCLGTDTSIKRGRVKLA